MTITRVLKDADHLVVVSHGGILSGLLAACTGRDFWTDWRPCGITVLERTARTQRHWRPIGMLADDGHLGDAYREPPRLIQG